MIPGETAFAEVAVATLPAELNQSTADPFEALLAQVDQAQDLIYLLVARPYDPALPKILLGPPAPIAEQAIADDPDLAYIGAETMIYASDRGYRTGPGDALPDQDFPARLEAPLNRQASIPVDRDRASQSFGAIVAINDGAGSLDPWLSYDWGGRSVEVRGGVAEFEFAEFGLLFNGTAQGLEWDEARVTVRLRDRSEAFIEDVPTVRYQGSGGAEGGADLAGAVKPVCLGTVANLTPVLVDANDLVYQIGSDLRAVSAVRDRGVALTAAGDVPDIFTTTVAGGSYKTSLAAGLIRLGATPAGTVTVDATGPAAAGDTTGTIVRYVATSLLGGLALDETELDLGSFADLDALQPAPIGVYVDRLVSAAALVDGIMAGIGGWWSFNRDGQMIVGRLDEPGDAAGSIEARDITAIARAPAPAPAWRHRVDFGRVWTVQGDEDLAGSVGAADRELWEREYRSITVSDGEVRGRSRLAGDHVEQTLMISSADAAIEADRLQALHGQTRDRYRVSLARGLFRYTLGETRTLAYPRFGLDAGRNFRVVGLVEDVASDSVQLDLWG